MAGYPVVLTHHTSPCSLIHDDDDEEEDEDDDDDVDDDGFYLMSGRTMLCHLLRTSYTGLDEACWIRIWVI